VLLNTSGHIANKEVGLTTHYVVKTSLKPHKARRAGFVINGILRAGVLAALVGCAGGPGGVGGVGGGGLMSYSQILGRGGAIMEDLATDLNILNDDLLRDIKTLKNREVSEFTTVECAKNKGGAMLHMVIFTNATPGSRSDIEDVVVKRGGVLLKTKREGPSSSTTKYWIRYEKDEGYYEVLLKKGPREVLISLLTPCVEVD
jgi:hypothetical protein